MKIIVSEEIESVCPTFVGACVEARVENTPYSKELWDEINSLGGIPIQPMSLATRTRFI